MKNLRDERIGVCFKNNFNSIARVIEYKSSQNVTVLYDNGTVQETSWSNLQNANFKSPKCKTIYGVGFLGETKKKSLITQS